MWRAPCFTFPELKRGQWELCGLDLFERQWKVMGVVRDHPTE
jgi:hypothetical protein